jgi:hypothetical protein
MSYMKRQRKKKNSENSLLTAMRFVSLAQRATGPPETTHCRLFNMWANASNSVISVGHRIQEDIQVYPHTATLASALENLPDSSFALTLMEDNRLAIRAGEFESIVHCLNANELPVVGPDASSYVCDDRLAEALNIAGLLVADGATKVVNASIQIRNGSCLASNGNVIIEAWHGVSMPDLLIVPKAFAVALHKAINSQGKSLYRVGFGSDSLTTHFEDGAWLKTQLWPSDTDLPDLMKFLNVPTTPVPIPEGFFEIVKRLEPFSEDGQILITGGEFRVTKQSMKTYAVESAKHLRGLSIEFSIKSLLTIQPYVSKVHFNAAPGVSLFYGDTVRCAVATKG